MASQNKKKVIVGMSGGVDSSVTAFLLKKEGYDVIGVFMKFWKEPGEKFVENKCCSIEAFGEVRKICQSLKIPVYIINVEKRFKKEIVDYFLEEYKSGRTPNPCVKCNKKIKFRILLGKMLELKADFIATGHYASIKKEGGKYHLYKAKDDKKDQSYFLYNLGQKELKRILFSLSGYKKEKVREIARKNNLPVFDKKDSQDLCFIKEKSPQAFLTRNLKLKTGTIEDEKGKTLGRHKGLALYTIGQRRGINIGGDGPYYVIKKDHEKNTLIVTNKMNQKEKSKSMLVKDVNWVAGQPKFPARILVQTRYQNLLTSAIIKTKRGGETYFIEFDKFKENVVPGQSAVFYKKNGEVAGGGVIC